MKRFSLLSLALSIATFSASANILTVDNTPSSAADYNSITDAYNAAASGDTLLIYGSTISYGSPGLYKPLTFLGSGGYPSVSNEKAPTFDYINVHASGSGSTFSGIAVTDYLHSIGGNVNNISIINCVFTNTVSYRSTIDLQGTCSNWVITGSTFVSNSSSVSIINLLYASNWLIKNNYFQQETIYNSGASVFGNANTSIVIKNNIILGLSHIFFQCNDLTLSNNIFISNLSSYTDIATSGDCDNCNFNNNLQYNSDGGTMTTLVGSGNMDNANPQFVSFSPFTDPYKVSNDYSLAAGSPGKSAGTDGQDLGLYGDNFNWNNRLYPTSIPHQELFEAINTSAPQGATINFNLKARKADQ